MRARPQPDLVVETDLFARGYQVVAGMDEVGRGAWAGPVTVGVAAVLDGQAPPPPGLADSKYLSARARERLLPHLHAWLLTWAVGSATPVEIDALGIVGALRLAGHRALDALPLAPDVVLLDGTHDYLTGPGRLARTGRPLPPVHTRAKADATCASASAASVLAKCHRDGHMRALAAEHPHYAWESNSGYGAAVHRQAVGTHGLSPQHRRSWKVQDVPAAAPAPGAGTGTR